MEGTNKKGQNIIYKPWEKNPYNAIVDSIERKIKNE